MLVPSSPSAGAVDSSSSEEFDGKSWVEWFLRQRGGEFYVEVEDNYLQDDFNLTGLSSLVPYYEQALNLITDCEDDEEDPESSEGLEQASIQLYGLIHARYLLTTKGQAALLVKYNQGLYGLCPNVGCQYAVKPQGVLPIGSDLPDQGPTRVFCPKCCEMYVAKSSRLDSIDGSHFGSGACHVLVMNNPNLITEMGRNGVVPRNYEPHIFGFKQHFSKNQRDILQKALNESKLGASLGEPEPRLIDEDSDE